MTRTAEDIIAAGRRAERRRRAGFASAGAAGLVMVAVATAFVLPTIGAEQNPSAPVGAAPSKTANTTGFDSAPLFAFTFRGYDAGTLHVQDPVVASAAYQIASVYSDGHTSNDKPFTLEEVESQGGIIERTKEAGKERPALWAYLTVYRPGAFHPAGIRGARSVTVTGRRAVQATLPVGLDPRKAVDEGNKLFAWEYADDAWAAVTSYSSDKATPSFEDLGGLVEGLKPSKPVPARLPFTVGYVPEGYVPLQAGTHASSGLGGIATARAGDYGGATYAKPAAPTSGLTTPYDVAQDVIKDGFHIVVIPSTSSNHSPEPGTTRCYNASDQRSQSRPVNRSFCDIWSADGKVLLQVAAEGRDNKLPPAELKKIAKGVKVADVTDESTWTPAADALLP